MTNIRTVMGSMDLDELLSNRDTINARLLQVVDAATEAWGVKVTRIEIKDIAPPRDLVDSMARQMKAEREKRAQILEAEGLAAGRDPQGRRREAGRRADRRGPQGSRLPRRRGARALRRRPRPRPPRWCASAIAKGNVQAINYFVANNYVKALEAIAKSPNQKILMMPLEASSVIGSLAGLAEITSEAFGRNGAGGEPALRLELAAANCRARAAACRRPDQTCCLSVGELISMQSMFPMLSSLGFWNWFILAVLLFILETVVPGRALPVVRPRRRRGRCACRWQRASPGQWQLIAFGVISVLTVFWVRRLSRGDAQLRPARPQRARQSVHRPLSDRRAGDPERPRQGARRRHSVDRRRADSPAGARDRRGGQGQRPSGGERAAA